MANVEIRLYVLNHSVKCNKLLQPINHVLWYNFKIKWSAAYFVRNVWHLRIELLVHGCNNFRSP